MSKIKALGLAVAFIATTALLSSIVFCEDSIKDTTITAKVSPSISITPPDAPAAWTINPGILNTYTKNITVNANADWEVGVKGPNGAYMQAIGPDGTNYTLTNYLQIAATNVNPFKPSTTTNNYFLKGTKHGSNQGYPITFQQRGSFDDVVEYNGTPLGYSIVVTFTGKLM